MSSENKYQKKIFTIPNLLSAFRLVLIPVFIWTYVVEKKYYLTAGILLLSAITDIADGYIARHFNMISDLGKMLDPVADKLTQLAMLFCLVTRFRRMRGLLIILAIKEISVGLTSLLAIHKSGVVTGADWHGKVTTTLIDLMMLVHLVWFDIPEFVSNVMIALCFVMMMISWVLYILRNVKVLIGK